MALTREEAAALDAQDPLARFRDRFVGADSPLVYFDGNSLGRPLRRTARGLADFVNDEWGSRLIRGWDETWFEVASIDRSISLQDVPAASRANSSISAPGKKPLPLQMMIAAWRPSGRSG